MLVLDVRTTRVISAALSMFDIMEKRITLVEPLEKNRQPFKEMEALYIISSTAEAISRILLDFKNEADAKYAFVHIYFLEPVKFTLSFKCSQ